MTDMLEESWDDDEDMAQFASADDESSTEPPTNPAMTDALELARKAGALMSQNLDTGGVWTEMSEAALDALVALAQAEAYERAAQECDNSADDYERKIGRDGVVIALRTRAIAIRALAAQCKEGS